MEPPSSSSSLPSSFVIMHSVSKRHNVGTIARCCTAFNVAELVLVGSHHYNTFGSHGSDSYVDISHFDTLVEATKHLKEVKGCKIIGIEITEGAIPIENHPFEGNTAFLLGNEGDGLSSKQMALCDSFVYIRQFGSGTASLNVAVASSIVLHHFALWAGFKERDREGFKFVVAERQNRSTKRGIAGGRAKASASNGDEREELSFDLFEEGEEGDEEPGGSKGVATGQPRACLLEMASQTDSF